MIRSLQPYRINSAPQPRVGFQEGDRVQVAAWAKANANRVGVVWYRTDQVYVVRFDRISTGFHYEQELELATS